MLKEDHKINGLQQMISTVAIVGGALVICVGAWFGMAQVSEPGPEVELPGFAGKSDLVVARVNGHEIRLSDVVMARAELPQDAAGLPAPLVLETVINDLIERHLLAEAGWKAGLTRTDTIRGRIEFERDKLLRDHYVASLIEDRVSERDVRRLYKEQYLNVEARQEVRLWQILVRTPEEAEAVLAGLKEGRAFGDVARQFSIDGFAVVGGDMGYVSAENLLPEVAAKAFATEEGAISGPFSSSFGWHVLYVEDQRLKDPPPLIAVRDTLRRELLEKVMTEELDRLRKAAKIERVQPPLEVKLDRAMVAAQ